MSKDSSKCGSKCIKEKLDSSKGPDYAVDAVEGVEYNEDDFIPESLILHNKNREYLVSYEQGTPQGVWHCKNMIFLCFLLNRISGNSIDSIPVVKY